MESGFQYKENWIPNLHTFFLLHSTRGFFFFRLITHKWLFNILEVINTVILFNLPDPHERTEAWCSPQGFVRLEISFGEGQREVQVLKSNCKAAQISKRTPELNIQTRKAQNFVKMYKTEKPKGFDNCYIYAIYFLNLQVIWHKCACAHACVCAHMSVCLN